MIFLCIKDNKIIKKRSHVDVNHIIRQLKNGFKTAYKIGGFPYLLQ